MKKIGNVTIDDLLYPGKDLYSDEERIENKLLKIVKENDESKFIDIIHKEKSWGHILPSLIH